MKESKKRQDLVAEYMAETFSYGGVIMTRGQIISELQAARVNQRFIDRYMQGLEMSKRIRAVTK